MIRLRIEKDAVLCAVQLAVGVLEDEPFLLLDVDPATLHLILVDERGDKVLDGHPGVDRVSHRLEFRSVRPHHPGAGAALAALGTCEVFF